MLKNFGVVLVVGIWLGCCVLSSIGNYSQAWAQQEQESRQSKPPVKRALRPQFKPRDWRGIYFGDLFAEGLKGSRPAELGSAAPLVVAGTGGGGNSQPEQSGEFKWSELISRQVLEDEVKRRQIRLTSEVTTPSNYRGQHLQARLSFTMLAMLFAVIEKYDGDVRWQEDSQFVRQAFARAAATARTGSEQAYANARQVQAGLQDLVRGGSFPQEGNPTEDFLWDEVVDRGPLMTLLEELLGELKPMTASSAEATANAEELLHLASLVAVMGEVLRLPEMYDYDEEDYAAHAKAMTSGALQLVAGVKSGDYNQVEQGVNGISNSCSNCHADWR